MGEIGTIAVILGVLLVGVPALVVVLIFLARPMWRVVSSVVVHVVTFIGREIADVLRIIGAMLTSIILAPIAGLNVVLGRWASASHYGRAIREEMGAAAGCVYRVMVGNPARLFMLTALTEGFEHRIPHAIAHAPLTAGGAASRGQFDGFTIVGTLPGGGSGAKLYVAEPSARKIAAYARDGQREIGRVVVKSFSLSDGSTLPQIVRENRSLPAAQRMGLILEHELTEEKFYYVTRYVPGESLAIVTNRLHAMGTGMGVGMEGLGDGARLREAVGYASDILRTLSRYHSGGLWHKDVKPDNIIVHDGKAELVDFGLVTPLRSSMTLTTHGTEYFRDPEMVRMALRGVKVHEVDGAKFDIYAAGAVLYSMIENSFPAHGGLSQIVKKCPEALRWVVRRAMTDYDRRYETAAAMLGDIEQVMTAVDPFALRPAELASVMLDRERGVEPSSRVLPIRGPDMDEVGGPRVGRAMEPAEEPEFPVVGVVREGNVAEGPRAPNAAMFGGARGERPVLRVVGWWSGKYSLEPAALGSAPGFDTAEALADERVRAKAARKGLPIPVRLRRKRRAQRLSPGARIGILVGVGALVANMGWIGGSSESRTNLGQAVLAMRRTFGFSMAAQGEASKGRVLVLWDGAGLDAAARASMNGRLDGLARAGFELVGTTAAAEDPARAADEAEQITDLRTQIGVGAFHSESTAAGVREWLETHPGLLMVAWIRLDEAKRPDAWLIPRSDASQDAFRAANRAFRWDATRSNATRSNAPLKGP